ncbi:LysM domain-containing protein [Telmatospirillum sp.]|uniref:LysM peptidoglycan-binding domain-containing protein n=1 Tax=Telmatospirillum sp. TaxID=2079197 RepID=UPI0028486041|nr:LysM domain-containing protein [Telmatospirillum sp.]MDR3439630.1 LysM domain-containing protein [Telmatospirillum sp.]
MADQAPPKTGFERWQDDIDKAVGDAKWNIWDCEIQMAVNEYNHHLLGTAGYLPLDWQLIKAMLWVETGANSSEWKNRPMQIGVAGDPGLTSFLSSKEGSDLILPPALKGRLTAGSARTIPAHNIRAGIGYLLMRMANFEDRSVPGADPKVYEVTVKTGDSVDKIAKTQESTVDTLKKLNPTATVLRPGQVLKCQKASIQRVITGWRHISATSIAQRYNGGGDPNYAKKLDYASTLVRKGETVLCAQ